MHLALLVLTLLMVVGFSCSSYLEQCSIQFGCSPTNAHCGRTNKKKLELAFLTSEHIHSNAVVHYNLRFDTGLVYSVTNHKISKIYDQGLSQTHATQSTVTLQPVISQSRQNGHRFMYFNGNGNKRLLGNLNLNPAAGQFDLLTFFVVFRVDGFNANTYWVRNGLFGHHDGHMDKFICFMPDGKLMVAGATNDNILVRDVPNKANPGAIGVWNVLSVQWNVEGGAAASSVYCNGKLLAVFQAQTMSGDVRFSIGDVDPRGVVPLHGAIGEFVMYRELELSESLIKQHHAYFVDKWGIDADPITY